MYRHAICIVSTWHPGEMLYLDHLMQYLINPKPTCECLYTLGMAMLLQEGASQCILRCGNGTSWLWCMSCASFRLGVIGAAAVGERNPGLALRVNTLGIQVM